MKRGGKNSVAAQRVMEVAADTASFKVRPAAFVTRIGGSSMELDQLNGPDYRALTLVHWREDDLWIARDGRLFMTRPVRGRSVAVEVTTDPATLRRLWNNAVIHNVSGLLTPLLFALAHIVVPDVPAQAVAA